MVLSPSLAQSLLHDYASLMSLHGGGGGGGRTASVGLTRYDGEIVMHLVADKVRRGWAGNNRLGYAPPVICGTPVICGG
jgi:hypothetical protein